MNTKMKFSKKILSIALCLAMVLQFVPMTASASETKNLYIGELQLYDQYTTDGVTAVSGAPGENVESYAHWVWSTRTLTLKNFTLTMTAREIASGYSAGIYYDGTVNLVLIGDNKITVNTPTGLSNSRCYGFQCGNALTINGEGSLSVTSPGHAIYARSITIDHSGAISATASTGGEGCGLHTTGALNIQGTTLTLFGKRSAISAENVNIEDATITASCNLASVIEGTDITIKKSTVKASHGWPTSYTAYNGISASGALNIENSNIEAVGSKGNNSVSGIGLCADGNISITNSTVNATAGTGIRFKGSSFTIQNSTVTASGNGTNSYTRGIYGNGVSITDSTVTVTSTRAAFNYAPSVDIDKSAVWYGADSAAATEAGAKFAGELSSNYSQKYVRIEPYDHTHSWTYSVDGCTVNAACEEQGCIVKNGGSATLTAENQTYTGSALTPATITYSDDWVGSKPTEISYTDNVNVGTATATITVEGQTLSTTFQITAASIADATVTLNPESGTYTGTAYAPEISVAYNGMTLAEGVDYTFWWYNTGLTEVGAYIVNIYGAGNFAGSTTKTFKVNAASLSDITVEQVGTLTYTGEAQTPTVSTSATAVNGQTVTFTYLYEDEDGESEGGGRGGSYGALPQFTEAGTYTAKYKASAPNHEASYGEFTVTVDKATVTEPDLGSVPYNGEVQRADIEDNDIYRNTTRRVGAVPGKYQHTLKLNDPENYKWSTTDDDEVIVYFEITKAENAWITEPSISGWTYGETANAPTYEAKFGEVTVVYTGTANDGTAYNSETAPTKAGNYVATFTVEDEWRFSGLAATVDFTIARAPVTHTGTDKTATYTPDMVIDLREMFDVDPDAGEASYYITDLTGSGSFTDAPYLYRIDKAGTFTVLFSTKITATHSAGIARAVLTINPADPAIGTVSANVVENTLETSAIVLTRENTNIPGNLIVDAGQTLALGENEIKYTFTPTDTDNYTTVTGTVNVKVVDTQAPTGKVYFDERNGWESFLNTITFGLFYKDEVTVKVEATDTLSGVAKIEYFAADKAMTFEEVKAITTWTAYENGVAVTVEDAKQFVYFVRITDNAGNVTYLSTDGAEYDTTAPAISGIENGKTYYTTQKVTVTDKNIESITLNGETASESITLEGNKEATYTIVATDKAGNVTTYTVTMKPIADVDTTIDGITEDDVTSDDKKTVQDVIDEIDELLKDEDLTDDEKAALEEIKDNAEKLIDKIEEADAADETENIKKVEDVTAENVTPEDKTDLEKAKEDLEKALEDYAGNYTDDEKKAIEDEIKRIDDALEVIEHVEAVEELINKLPETITKDDEAAIKAADDAYNALTDYEKSLVDDAAKKALDDAKAALAELNKPADGTSPNTGDNSNLWLWFALLFVSGTGIFAITIYDRKRKAASKR